MKKLFSLMIISGVFLLSSSAVFSQSTSISTKVISGETYVKLSEVKKAANLNYENVGKNTIKILDAKDSMKNLIKKVTPSVVAIIGEDKNLNSETVKDYYYSKIPAGLMHGSGVIISKDGRIITNNHVVENMKEIYVVLYNKKSYKAKLLYKNKDLDLALIKINCSNLRPIEFEKMSNISTGDEVIAIGTPLYFGWSNSVTKGVISGLNRPVEETYTFLQTDASINPGNSGGPLINMNGKLVGINTLGIDWFDGINFSIPVENVEYFLNHYNKYGKVRRCYTGLEFEESWLALMGIPSDQGLKIISIKEDCIIQKDKVQEGDILESIDKKPVTSIATYNELLKSKLPGQEVSITFLRDTKRITIKARLAEFPDPTNQTKPQQIQNSKGEAK